MGNKYYYIVALLDDKGKEAIFNLQQKLGIKPDNLNVFPHITLSVYEETINVADLLEYVKEFSQKQKAVDLCLFAIAVFHTTGLAAVPLISEELFELYCSTHQKYDEYCREYSKLKSGWLPHVSIAYNSENIINEKMSVVSNAFNFIHTKLIALGVSSVDKNGKLTGLGRFPLQDQ